MSLPFKVALFLLPACLWASSLTHAEDKLIGTPAKEWQLTDWMNSKPLTLKDQRGKVVSTELWIEFRAFQSRLMGLLDVMTLQ